VASVPVRMVGIRATGGSAVYRTTRAEKTSSPLRGRRGGEALALGWAGYPKTSEIEAC
jgi:hypothetical protein